VLLWPRGASAQIRGALADYYRRSADALEAVTDRLIHPTLAARTLDEVMNSARAAGLRLDDALREYLAERGTKSVPIAELTAVTNGASRVRLAAEAIAGMQQTSPRQKPSVLREHEANAARTRQGHRDPAPHTDPATHTDPPTPTIEQPLSPVLNSAGGAVSGSAATTAAWFRQIADVLTGNPKNRPTPPAAEPVLAESQVLDTFRQHPGSLADPARAAQGRIIWSASLYVDDVTRLQTRLSASIAVLNRPGHAGAPAEIESDQSDGHLATPDGIHAGSAS